MSHIHPSKRSRSRASRLAAISLVCAGCASGPPPATDSVDCSGLAPSWHLADPLEGDGSASDEDWAAVFTTPRRAQLMSTQPLSSP